MKSLDIMKNSAITTVVLAAELSKRLGCFKPFLPLEPDRIIEWTVNLFQTVQQLMAAFKDTSAKIFYPTFSGQRGHPTLLDFDFARRNPGDVICSTVFAQVYLTLVNPGEGSILTLIFRIVRA